MNTKLTQSPSLFRRAPQLAAVIVAATFASASAMAEGNGGSRDGEEGHDSIVGLWHVLFATHDNGVTAQWDEGYDQWYVGGAELLNDNAPPMPANGGGNYCLGVYKKIGPRTYKLRHPFWVADANHPILAGSGIMFEEVTVGKDGNSYTGTFENFTYDLNGNVASHTKGTLAAERIVP